MCICFFMYIGYPTQYYDGNYFEQSFLRCYCDVYMVSWFSGGLHSGECLEYGWFKYIDLCATHATLCLLPLCQ